MVVSVHFGMPGLSAKQLLMRAAITTIPVKNALLLNTTRFSWIERRPPPLRVFIRGGRDLCLRLSGAFLPQSEGSQARVCCVYGRGPTLFQIHPAAGQFANTFGQLAPVQVRIAGLIAFSPSGVNCIFIICFKYAANNDEIGRASCRER